MDTTHYKMTYQQITFSYQLILSKRKSVAIFVYPNRSILVKAPQRMKLSLVEKMVFDRARWIVKQLNNMPATTSSTPLEYNEGAHHFYLGEKYSLKISKGNLNTVLFNDNYFYVICRGEISATSIKRNIERWYLKQSKIIFESLMKNCWLRCQTLHARMPTLKIRKMTSRWGSYSLKDHTVTLNSELIKTPEKCIESVILHEYCHIKHMNHSPSFYRLLEQFSPDWKVQKETLKSFI